MPATVIVVNVDGRRAWRRRILAVERPFARAITMKSSSSVATMSARSSRWYTAIELMARVREGRSIT